MPAAPSVVIEPSTYHAMSMQVYLCPDNEVCGLLFGKVEAGSVRVLGNLPASVTGKKALNLAKTLELGNGITNNGANEQVQLIGWYHTHVGKGCEPSRSDVTLQDKFQNVLPNFFGLILAAEETPANQRPPKILMRAFKSNQGQPITLTVEIGSATKVMSNTCRQLASSSLAEITRLLLQPDAAK